MPQCVDIRMTDGGEVVSLAPDRGLLFWYPFLLAAEEIQNV
jgi:hypothetical protein